MELYYLKNNLLLGSLCIAVLAGLWQFRKLGTAMKLFWLMICVCLLTETIAYGAAVKYRHNAAVYSVSSIIGIFMICLYFNYSVDRFRKYNIGIFVGAISVGIGCVSNFIIQSVNSFPSYFLHYQTQVIIALVTWSLADMLQQQKQLHIKKEPHFWTSIILLLSWTLSYFNWTLFQHYLTATDGLTTWAILFTFSINFLTNLAFAWILFVTPKMQRDG